MVPGSSRGWEWPPGAELGAEGLIPQDLGWDGARAAPHPFHGLRDAGVLGIPSFQVQVPSRSWEKLDPGEVISDPRPRSTFPSAFDTQDGTWRVFGAPGKLLGMLLEQPQCCGSLTGKDGALSCGKTGMLWLQVWDDGAFS